MNYWTIYFFVTGIGIGVIIGLAVSIHLHRKANSRRLK